MTHTHFSSDSKNILIFESTCQELTATVNVVQGYISCVSRDQSTVGELEKMLFSSRHRLLHRLISSSKSNSRLNSSCNIFSVLLSWSCSTLFLRIYFLNSVLGYGPTQITHFNIFYHSILSTFFSIITIIR